MNSNTLDIQRKTEKNVQQQQDQNKPNHVAENPLISKNKSFQINQVFTKAPKEITKNIEARNIELTTTKISRIIENDKRRAKKFKSSNSTKMNHANTKAINQTLTRVSRRKNQQNKDPRNQLKAASDKLHIQSNANQSLRKKSYPSLRMIHNKVLISKNNSVPSNFKVPVPSLSIKSEVIPIIQKQNNELETIEMALEDKKVEILDVAPTLKIETYPNEMIQPQSSNLYVWHNFSTNLNILPDSELIQAYKKEVEFQKTFKEKTTQVNQFLKNILAESKTQLPSIELLLSKVKSELKFT